MDSFLFKSCITHAPKYTMCSGLLCACLQFVKPKQHKLRQQSSSSLAVPKNQQESVIVSNTSSWMSFSLSLSSMVCWVTVCWLTASLPFHSECETTEFHILASQHVKGFHYCIGYGTGCLKSLGSCAWYPLLAAESSFEVGSLVTPESDF